MLVPNVKNDAANDETLTTVLAAVTIVPWVSCEFVEEFEICFALSWSFLRQNDNSDKFLHEYARFERIKKVKFGSCLDLDFQLNGGW